MTKSTILIFLFFSLTLNAQRKNDTTSRRNKEVHNLSVDVFYGNSIFSNKFYNQLNSIDKINFNLPIRQIGIGLSTIDMATMSHSRIGIQTFFSYLLQNKLTFNDTIHSYISGFSYSLAYGTYFFNKSKYFRFNTYFGFNAGRTVLTKLDNINFKNPFFVPKISLQPKVIIRRLCFSLFIDYCYDISNKNWKKMNISKTQYQLDKFDQSNLTLMFAIGYCPF